MNEQQRTMSFNSKYSRREEGKSIGETNDVDFPHTRSKLYDRSIWYSVYDNVQEQLHNNIETANQSKKIAPVAVAAHSTARAVYVLKYGLIAQTCQQWCNFFTNILPQNPYLISFDILGSTMSFSGTSEAASESAMISSASTNDMPKKPKK